MTIARIEEAIWHQLNASAALTALATGGVSHDIVPQDATDKAVVIEADDIQPMQALAGPVGYAQSGIKITCVAPRRYDAQKIAEAVRVALDGFHGTITLTDARTLFVSCIQVGQMSAAFFVAEDNKDEGRSAVVLPLTCSHELPTAIQ